MITDLESYLRYSDGVRRRTARDVAALPPGAATWRPPARAGEAAEAGWSIGQIVDHIGAARLYFASAYRGEGWLGIAPDPRRSDQATWLPWLEESGARFVALVKDTPPEWLTRRIEAMDAPPDTPGSRLSGWRILMMAIEHEAITARRSTRTRGSRAGPCPTSSAARPSMSPRWPPSRAGSTGADGRLASFHARHRLGPALPASREGSATVDYDVLVIGAGTAGTFAARAAVGLHARTAIAEHDGFAGTCLGTG